MAEETAVFAIELRSAFVADLESRAGGIETMIQHQIPRWLKAEVLLILKRTHRETVYCGLPKIKIMRAKFQIIAFALSIVFSIQSQAQTGDTIFPKGELSTTRNHTGNVWLKELNAGDSTFDYAIAVAAFDAGAKLD